MFFLNHPATLSAMDMLRISITVWPECDVLAPVITRILPLMRSMMRQRCKRTSMSTRDMRLLGSSEITNDLSQAKNWKIAKRQFSDFFPFRLYHRVRWSSQVFEPMVLFWLMYAWQLGDDKWHGKDLVVVWKFSCRSWGWEWLVCIFTKKGRLADQVQIETCRRC